MPVVSNRDQLENDSIMTTASRDHGCSESLFNSQMEHAILDSFVEKSDSATLLPIIERHVSSDVIVCSDEWNAYNHLGNFQENVNNRDQRGDYKPSSIHQ